MGSCSVFPVCAEWRETFPFKSRKILAWTYSPSCWRKKSEWVDESWWFTRLFVLCTYFQRQFLQSSWFLQRPICASEKKKKNRTSCETSARCTSGTKYLRGKRHGFIFLKGSPGFRFHLVTDLHGIVSNLVVNRLSRLQSSGFRAHCSVGCWRRREGVWGCCLFVVLVCFVFGLVVLSFSSFLPGHEIWTKIGMKPRALFKKWQKKKRREYSSQSHLRCFSRTLQILRGELAPARATHQNTDCLSQEKAPTEQE